MAKSSDRLNSHVLGKLAVMVLIMFGFGYAMVPIYRAICDATGVNFLTRKDTAAEKFARNTQVDTSRQITVEFDSNSRGAWRFKPQVNHASVHPGEMFTIVYELVNTEDRPTTGQAIPSYAPKLAAGYFRKIECFCFEQQTLGPNQSQQFPVVFVIDPAIPADVNTITLSYTYFEVEGLAGAPPAVVAQPGRGG